jgi:DNA-binding NarL/FixJ family response regulator
LVDDHPLVREGLAVTINQEPDLEVCGQAASASQALQAAAALHPEVAVVDLTLEGSHGIDLLKDLRAQHPEIRVLVLSMHDEMLYAERAARAGARGYLMKKEPPERLVEAIRKLLRGDLYFSEALILRMHLELTGGRCVSGTSPVARLTDRELTVLEMLGQGKKTSLIADLLHVSVKTVQAHCEHMKEKLELPDHPTLMRFAVHWLDTEHDTEQTCHARQDPTGDAGDAGRTRVSPLSKAVRM